MIQLHASTFVKRDEQLLGTFSTVKVFTFRHHKGIKVLGELLRLKLFLFRWVWNSNLVYVWFADFHAVLPVLFARMARRPAVVVIGGVDAAYLPEFGYGTKTRLLGRLSVWFTVKYAHRLLPVSEFTLNDLRRNISAKAAMKAEVVHNCYSPVHVADPAKGERKWVLCVAMAASIKTLYIKSVDVFLAAAEQLPEYQFVIVGLGPQAMAEVERIRPQNVQLYPPVSFEQLSAIYAKTKVICQFSRQESFGIALLEGLAAGCVPVIAPRGGPTEVFAGTGVPSISQYSAQEAVRAIRQAYEMPVDRLKAIQNKVLPTFDCAIRQQRLQNIFERLAV